MNIVTQIALMEFSVFAVTLAFSEFFVLFRLSRRDRFPLRLVAALAIVECSVVLLSFASGLIIEASGYSHVPSVVLSIASHIAIFVTSVAACIIYMSEPPMTLLFCCLSGYMIQHILSSFHPEALFPTPEGVTYVLRLAFFFVMYAAAYFIYVRPFASVLKDARSVGFRKSGVVLMSALCLFVTVAVGYLGMDFSEESPALYALLSVCQVAVCVFVLWAQYMILVSRKNIRDAMTVERLRELERKQYEFVKNSMDAVNIKFHDIKHMIRTRDGTGGDRLGALDPSYLRDMADDIDAYDSQIRTGNEALDVILTEKSMLCRRDGVKFTALADGGLMDGMDESDVYSLFGNALDNALEYLVTLPEEERVLKVYVRRYGEGFVSVTVRNRYLGPPLRGTPRTTKSDASEHGFGVLSMRRVAEEYGGTFGIVAEGGTFTVNILLPLPVKKRGADRSIRV